MLLFACASALAVTLEDAWRAAEEGSVDLALVRENTVQTETYKGKAWALVQPKLVLGGHYTINEYEIAWDPDETFQVPEEYAEFIDLPDQEPIVFQKKQYFDANVSVVQPLFNGTALPLLQGAKATISAAKADEVAARSQIKAGIARAFYGVAVSRDLEGVAKNALENAEKHGALVRRQADVGVAAPTARLQAEIAVSKARRQLAQAHEGVVAAEQAFSRLTGLPGETALELPDERALPYDTTAAAASRAVDRRPDLSAARDRARAAKLQKLASDLEWLPSLEGRFTYNWTENSGGFNDDPTLWMVVFTANWVLWDGGFRLAEERRTASVARQAQFAVDKAVGESEERVRNLWEAHTRASEALVQVRHERALAAENQRIAEAAYEAGAITFLELEDARLGLRAAQATELAERMNRDLAAIDLLVATGDL